MQVLESGTEPRQYALCYGEGGSGACKAIYGTSYSGSVEGLGDLIDIYKSELLEKALQGYLCIDLDYSLDWGTLEAAPSEQTLKARDTFYSLLGLISKPKIIMSVLLGPLQVVLLDTF